MSKGHPTRLTYTYSNRANKATHSLLVGSKKKTLAAVQSTGRAGSRWLNNLIDGP